MAGTTINVQLGMLCLGFPRFRNHQRRSSLDVAINMMTRADPELAQPLCPTSVPAASPIASTQEDLLLTYQITYWNYLGWDDTFNFPGNDTPKRDYVR